ncbi:MAG: YgiQ family radical SAM protein [Candidatus Cloacimonetes bacterium]|nr:YgiQ family radical SAM protein [Candidatus Cloacimonadota bacterium]
MKYLPVTREECLKLGWDELDIIIVTGDAYIDHPAFGAAIIGRFLVANGFRVGIIPQPNWKSDTDFLRLGKPKLFFGVTAGNLDSMVNHYTAQRKIRSEDAYSPAGKAGLRPDRATIVYTQRLKQIFKGVPVILGGIEASLRRIPHYDFWSDKVRNSVLLDSKADLLIYGMAEKTVLKVAMQLSTGVSIKELKDLPGTVTNVSEVPDSAVLLPDYEKVYTPDLFWEMNRMFHQQNRFKTLYQRSGMQYLKHNLPETPLDTGKLDEIYALPFARKPHPIYKNIHIPAFEQIKNSITSHRGCFGGCHFCSLNYHQGKYIQSRSITSIVDEVDKLREQDYFFGTVSDIGGPSANMYGMECRDLKCPRKSCIYPKVCEKLDTTHKSYMKLLEEVRHVDGVNHVFVSSGIRADLALKNMKFIELLVKYHTGGRLKIAPEHKSDKVLKLMNKQTFSTYQEYVKLFSNYCEQYGFKHQLTPYIMVGHPGTTLKEAVDLAVYLKENNLKLKQVQEFTPTPMTISSCMYYTGRDFDTGNELYIPKGREVKLQKAIVQWFKPENRKYVIEILKKAERNSLLSFFLEPEPPNKEF